jgi:hypothetical protein
MIGFIMIGFVFRPFLSQLAHSKAGSGFVPVKNSPFSTPSSTSLARKTAQLPPSDQHVTSSHWLRVLCVDQDLNTERTEDLRDLSVEALKARRPQRTSPVRGGDTHRPYHIQTRPWGRMGRVGQIIWGA